MASSSLRRLPGRHATVGSKPHNVSLHALRLNSSQRVSLYSSSPPHAKEPPLTAACPDDSSSQECDRKLLLTAPVTIEGPFFEAFKLKLRPELQAHPDFQPTRRVCRVCGTLPHAHRLEAGHAARKLTCESSSKAFKTSLAKRSRGPELLGDPTRPKRCQTHLLGL